MHCLVTGVAGFIGSSLAERLLADGHSVVGVDSFVEYYPRQLKLANLEGLQSHNKFRFIESDLVRLDFGALLPGVDWIFHQAAQAGVRASWGSNFDSYIHNNISATQVLLEALQKFGGVKKVVFASSSSIYGHAEGKSTSEQAIPQPVSPYGVTKLASEHMMTLYAKESGLPTVSLRYFTVFGPRQRPDMAFHRFIRAALTQEELLVFGDGEQSRDFTFISDIVDANILAAEKGQAGEVFNIGGGPHASVNQALILLGDLLGNLKVKRLERQKGDARHTYADISLARQRLGFDPKVSLKDGLQRQIEWLETILK